jgi:hypothetical protein
MKTMKYTINAFDTLAGSSYGTWTLREVAVELINYLESSQCPYELIRELTRDLAELHDEDSQYLDDLISDLIGHIDYYIERPECTLIEWHDNEIICRPYIDDDISRLDHIPESFIDDLVYHVNDHGNVDLCKWNPDKQCYEIVWSMV